MNLKTNAVAGPWANAQDNFVTLEATSKTLAELSVTVPAWVKEFAVLIGPSDTAYWNDGAAATDATQPVVSYVDAIGKAIIDRYEYIGDGVTVLFKFRG